MAKIKYRQRMREIDQLANALSDAVNALRADIREAGDDAAVNVQGQGFKDVDDGEFFVSVCASVTTTY